MVKKFILFCLVICCYAMINLSSAAPTTPKEVVKLTVDAILELLRDKSLDRDVRRTKIRNLVKPRFDYREMAKRTLATNWKKATDEEKDRFIDLYSQLLEWTYIGRIEAYSNETVQYDKEIIKGNRAQVNTFLETASAEIPIDYRLMKKGDAWVVYDVIIEQISLIRNYRSSYRSIVRNEGMSGLLVKMEQKIQELKIETDSGDSQA